MWASPGRLPAMEEDEEEGGVGAGAGAGACRRARGAMASCWGRFGLAALWRGLRRALPRRGRRHWRRGGRPASVLGAGGLNYDPLSYAHNFDDGGGASALEQRHREPDFTARFAPAGTAISPRRPSTPPPATAATA